MRQGRPLSPLLFAVAIEPLAEVFRKADEVQGIQIGTTMHTLSLFGDDMVLYVS